MCLATTTYVYAQPHSTCIIFSNGSIIPTEFKFMRSCICQATSQVFSANAENSHSQLIEFRDAIVSNQQYGQPLTDASEDVHWLIV